MKKSTWIILGIAVVLGIIYYFTKQDKISVGIKRLELPSFESAKVDAIEVIGRDKIRLKKEGDSWKMLIGEKEEARLVDVNQAYVKEMLDAVQKMESAYYVTDASEKQEELGVKGDKATSVTLKASEKPLWSLILGKSNPDGSRFARVPEDNTVYAVRGSFFALTRNGQNDWREKNFWHVTDPDIISFSVERPTKGAFTLEKKEDGDFKIAKVEPALGASFRPDFSALASLVRANLNLRANGFVDQKKELSTPIMILSAKSKDGKEEVLEIFAGDEHNYWARIKGAEQVYELSKNNFDRINKPLSEFRDMSIMSFDKDATTKLKLRAKSGLVIAEKTDGKWQLIEPKKVPSKFEFDPARVEEILNGAAGLRGERLAQASDKPEDAKWQKDWLLELSDDKGNTMHLYATKVKGDSMESLVQGNIDQTVYVVKNPRLLSWAKGLDAFKKEEFVLPPIDENTKGFESLPVDVQRKLLESIQQKKETH